jgi:hypothetical protein
MYVLEDATGYSVIAAYSAPTLYYIDVLYVCYGIIVLTLLLLINILLCSMNTNIQGIQLRRMQKRCYMHTMPNNERDRWTKMKDRYTLWYL